MPREASSSSTSRPPSRMPTVPTIEAPDGPRSIDPAPLVELALSLGKEAQQQQRPSLPLERLDVLEHRSRPTILGDDNGFARAARPTHELRALRLENRDGLDRRRVPHGCEFSPVNGCKQATPDRPARMRASRGS